MEVTYDKSLSETYVNKFNTTRRDDNKKMISGARATEGRGMNRR